MVLINRLTERVKIAVRTRMCYCSLLGSHGVQSGASNARCTLGRSRATPQCTPTVLSKQHAELFHTDMVTRI